MAALHGDESVEQGRKKAKGGAVNPALHLSDALRV